MTQSSRFRLIDRILRKWKAVKLSPEAESSAVAEIHFIFDDLIRYGLGSSEFEGATDDDIDAMANAQNVPLVPAVVREIMRLVGGAQGIFYDIGDFSPDYEGEWKSMVVEMLNEYPPGLNPVMEMDRMLVFENYHYEAASVIDYIDIEKANPPVWCVTEGERVTAVESVTSLFRCRAERVKALIDYRKRAHAGRL